MKSKIEIPKEILATIDFNNTLLGGAVEPQISMETSDEGIEVNLKMPGLAPDDLKVDIVDNRLLLYYLQPVLSNNEKFGFMTRSLSTVFLPENIDRESITAIYENKAWKINLPIDQFKKGFNKKIDIKY
ncbi:MAG: Hsp20 family protein [Bacteroidota bacterium]